ncbi:MAG: radical SAM protein [Patescibacteria group bacterium]
MFMHLELTGKCNLGCAHCYNEVYNLPSTKSKELTHQEWLRLIEEANALQCERFNFSGGEPLLYQRGNCDMLIELINACNAPVILLTNGHLLTKDRFKKLVGTGKLRAIRLSLDGFNSHDSFRGNGNHQLVLERIRMVKEESEIPLAVVTMINNSNMDDILPLYQRLKVLGINWWNLDIPFSSDLYKKAPAEFGIPPYFKVIAMVKELLKLYLEDKRPFRLGIANIYKSQIASVPYHEFDINMHPCCYRDIVCVKPNGDVNVCAAYNLKTAHVGEGTSLKVAYSTSKGNPFYSMKVREISECVSCRYLRICGGGCRADSQYLTGSIFSPDPKCCSLLPLVEKEILPILPAEERDSFMSLCNLFGVAPPSF